MKKGLGRGFESLIPTNLLDETFDPTAQQDGQISQLCELALDKILPDPDQPRRLFDDEALRELAESVQAHGVVQPIVVTPYEDGMFLIVAGERRWRAAQLAGLNTIPAIVRTLSGQHRLEVSLIENLQRRDLNPLETATAYLKLRDQFNMTLDQIGHRVGGKSASAISNTLRLLKLPKAVQTALFEGVLSEGHARQLVGLPEDFAASLMERIVRESWNVRKTEQVIAQWKKGGDTKDKTVNDMPVHYAETAAHLSERLGSAIAIRPRAKGAGQIVISFKNDDELARLRELLG